MRQESSRTHDVFLSHSSKDKTWADAACNVLERQRIRCWIAPRDITPGDEWGAAIIKGLNGSRMMVLIFSGHANASGQVRREVERAISQGMTVLPVRVEDVRPEGAMEFALGNRHWLDAFTPPVERKLELLARSVKAHLANDPELAPAPAPAMLTEKGADPAVPPETRGPRAFWLIAIAASLFGLVALGAIMIAIRTRNGETKTTVPDNSSTKVGRDDSVVEHKPAGDTDSSSISAAERRSQAASQGWVSLFNGKDLTGWKTHPLQPGNWHVANGVLIGSGPALSHLYTERGDFIDFHLRVEARFNRGGSGGVYLRCPFGPSLPSSEDPKWPDGFEATINSARIVPHITGGLYPGADNDVFINGNVPGMPFGQWFTMEVIADGKALAVLLNGKPSAYKFARNRLHPSGCIALQKYSPETVIEFRTIDIKELNRSDQKDSKEIRRFTGTAGQVTRVAFSPDGINILSGDNAFESFERTGKGHFFWFDHNYELRLWAVASGKNLFTSQGVGGVARNLALSSDGRYAASSSVFLSDAPVLNWDMKTINHIYTFRIKGKTHNIVCTALSFSADDRLVMATLTNGAVLSWDLETGLEQSRITLDTKPISQDEFLGAAFTSDRRHLVTGSRSGAVELWDLQSGKRLQTFAGHAGGVSIVACSADGRLILSAGSDKTIRLWDMATEKELMQLRSDEKPVRCVAFSPDSRRALSAGLDGIVHLWDLASGKEVCRMEGHTMGVNSVAFSPDGRRAVSGSEDTTVRLWQLPEADVAVGTLCDVAETPRREPVVKAPAPASKAETIPSVNLAPVKPADLQKSQPTVPDNSPKLISVKKVPEAVPRAARSIEDKPPGPLAASAADSPPRTAPDKAPVPPAVPPKEITNTIGMKLVLIPTGGFLMGSPDSDKDARDNEKPQHHVQITRPFYLGIHEVTQGQYRAVTGENPPRFKGSSGDLPVNWVSWNEAIAFCDKLSKRDGVKPYYQIGEGVQQLGGEGYRLPTEAEWEYACRAGSTTRYNFGDDAVSLNEFAWFRGNSGGRTHPVGQKRPNAWGLYDMHGNLWEWCEDWYDENYYRHSPGADPLGPSRADSRVFRGKCWLDPPPACRSAFRVGLAPGMRANYLGFRVARVRSGQ